MNRASSERDAADTGTAAVTVVDAPQRRRYEAYLDGALAGYVTYRLRPDSVVFIHTVVEPGSEGRGIGSRLAAAVLDDARRRDLSVVPRCPFIAAYIRRHPELTDLVVPGSLDPDRGPPPKA